MQEHTSENVSIVRQKLCRAVWPDHSVPAFTDCRLSKLPQYLQGSLMHVCVVVHDEEVTVSFSLPEYMPTQANDSMAVIVQAFHSHQIKGGFVLMALFDTWPLAKLYVHLVSLYTNFFMSLFAWHASLASF